MNRLRYLTAGESHGKGLVGIIEGMPAGLALEAGHIEEQLSRRQRGHGRGGRMKIESDKAELLSGVRHGKTIGSPIALLLWNKDWKNWTGALQVEPGGDESLKSVSIPRPGHADLCGSIKYGHKDLRSVLERASARETAMRTALSVPARLLLEEFGVRIASRVVSIGGAQDHADADLVPVDRMNAAADSSSVRCLSADAEERMRAVIDHARKAGDTLGGVFEVRVGGLPPALGGYAQLDRRLEGALSAAFMSLNAVKGVEIGLGFSLSQTSGSLAHDELYPGKGRAAARRTNRAGGLEGGMTTGETLVVRAAMKPLATLMKPLRSVDLKTGKAACAHIERSDVCAVPAAAVIGEALAALVLADAFLEKFGGDSIAEIRRHEAASRG